MSGATAESDAVSASAATVASTLAPASGSAPSIAPVSAAVASAGADEEPASEPVAGVPPSRSSVEAPSAPLCEPHATSTNVIPVARADFCQSGDFTFFILILKYGLQRPCDRRKSCQQRRIQCIYSPKSTARPNLAPRLSICPDFGQRNERDVWPPRALWHQRFANHVIC